MNTSAIRHSSFLVLTFLLAGGMAFVCGRIGPLPQRATGTGILDVAFGDAREVLSRALYHKADSYFHGGVEENEEVGSRNDERRCCNHSAIHNSSFVLPTSHPDPWRWINAHIRAPQVERHLAGTKAVEMMPWFWAAVKSDPHNIDAWTAAWYSAAHVMKDDALAQRVLDEAKAKNPASAELWLTEGQFRYKMGKGDVAAAKVCFEKARDLLLASCANDPARLGEDDRRTYDFACNYLKKIATP